MKENNLIKILIPLVAVVVVFESIVLVKSLNNSNTAIKVSKTDEATKSTQVTEEKPAVDLVFVTDTKEMKVGKTYKVQLDSLSKKNYKVGSLEMYIKYDPEFFNVTNIVSGEGLPKADFTKASTKKGVIVSNFMINSQEGFGLNKDQSQNIISFNISPKKQGISYLEISTGNDNKESVTMIVDKTTSKALTFSSNKLEINVTK